MLAYHPHRTYDSMDSDPTQVYQQALDAARQGDTTHLAAALTSGLDNNLTDNKGDTLLMLAAYHSHLETLQLLLLTHCRLSF